MYEIESFRAPVLAVTNLLVLLSVRFHLTGGAACFAHGEPRMTQDFDLVVQRSQLLPQVQQFVQGLQQAGFLFNERELPEALTAGRMIQILDTVNILKLDLYPRELIPGELERSVELPVFTELSLPVAALPDLTISKLVWISRGSHKSRRELRWLMPLVDELGQAFVNQFAAEHNLVTLLQEVLDEREEIE